MLTMTTTCGRLMTTKTHRHTTYHAVGNYYLKYSWGYFMQKKLHYIFLYSGHPEFFRHFLFAEKHRLGENLPNKFRGILEVKTCNTYSGYLGPSESIMYAIISARMVLRSSLRAPALETEPNIVNKTPVFLCCKCKNGFAKTFFSLFLFPRASVRKMVLGKRRGVEGDCQS